MSILGIFDIGKTALFASQAALAVTSNNIANVNTPGYSKKEIILNIANPTTTGAGVIGRGVTTVGIKRSYDRFIEAQLLDQQQSQGKSLAMDGAWGQIEPVFNEAIGLGLSKPLSEYFQAWQDVANSPDAQTPRNVVIQKAKSLVSAAQTMEGSITDSVSNINVGITDAVRQINSLASDIAALNQRIVQDEAGSNAETANDVRDQRGSKLTELAKLVDFTTREDSNGALTLTIGMRDLVAGGRTNTLSTVINQDGNRDLVLDGMNITSMTQKGELGGLLAARDDIQSGALLSLRKVIASVTQQVNTLHEQGFGLDGSTGNAFFNPLQLTTTDNSATMNMAATITNESQLTLDEYKITFDAGGNYTVSNKQTGSPLVPPVSGVYVSGGTISLPGIDVVITGGPINTADTFTISPLTTAISGFGVAVNDPRVIAASSAAAEVPGNGNNATLLGQLTQATVANLGNTTISDYYNGLVTTIGVMKRSSSDSLAFDDNLLSELSSKRESISGVSLDEEAMNLLRYQRSYEAGARMIKIADELLQTVLNL